MSLTAERLREVLDYNPETTWAVAKGGTTRIGKIAGC